MGDERISGAIGRIDAALARIETAAMKLPEREQGGDPALRDSVKKALADLDSLIESFGQ